MHITNVHVNNVNRFGLVCFGTRGGSNHLKVCSSKLEPASSQLRGGSSLARGGLSCLEPPRTTAGHVIGTSWFEPCTICSFALFSYTFLGYTISDCTINDLHH